MSYQTIGLRGSIVLAFVSICCILPALLLLFLGYEKGLEWNGNAVQTTCTVLQHDTASDRCSYSCNCRTTSTTSSSTRHCDTCYYTCYDGSIEVQYEVDDEFYKKWFEVYSNYRSESDIKSKLRKHYPIGDDITCYYQSDNPSNAKLKHVNTDVFLAFLIIFFILGGFSCVGWVVYEVIH